MASYEEYWIKRAERRMADRQTAVDASILQIQSAYEESMKELDKQIERLFLRFVRENNLSVEEAKQLLNEVISAKEIADIRNLIDTIEDAEIKSKLQKKIEASYYKERISRQEALKEAVQVQMSKIADVELQKTTEAYTDVMKEEYLHNIFDSQQLLGIGYRFDELPEKIIEEILKDEWSGKNYSKRIWGNTQTMAKEIEKIILHGQMVGTNSRKMAKKLNEIADTGMYACERLIRTETTYFTTMADLEASKQRGTKKIQIVATLDKRTSKQCREADGKIIPIEDAVSGKNIPPLHPFCRSVIIDVIEGLVHKVRRARDPETGKNYDIPADMTYKQWKKLPLSDKMMDIGQISGLRVEKTTNNTVLSEKQIQQIKDAIAKLSKDYNINLDYLEIGYDKKRSGAPLFYRMCNENGVYKSKLFINNASSFWTDENIQKYVFESKIFASRSIEDMVNHELAHVLTFQSCKTSKDYFTLESFIHPKYESSVTEYAFNQKDGAETIAEAFVKKRQGYAINMRSSYLVDKYVEVWKK